MRLRSIHTYPVKSCHRLDHDRATVEPWGLAGDRRWVVVEPDGTAVTQREEPVMSQIQPLPRPGGLLVRSSGLPELDVAEPATGELAAWVWRAPVPARPAGADADAWFSKVIGRAVRLLWLDDPTRRPTNPEHSRPGDRVSFADGFPLLVTNTASLDFLNDRLAESGSDEWPLPMTRFRPNVVVSAAVPWAEDGWLGRRLTIGAVTFRAVKMCDRCVLTTVDPETGVKGKEPLRILARHRLIDQKLMFGMNLIPDGAGEIAVGDPVSVA
jgi:uncharacterized protein